MRYLTASRDRQRLLLVLPDLTPLRHAALSIRDARSEGYSEGDQVFSYPAAPDAALSIVESFQPKVDPEAQELVDGLLARESAVAKAGALKEASPQRLDYMLPTELMEHQRRALAFGQALFRAGAPGVGLLMEMGTGKSLVALGLSDWLLQTGRAHWVLVLAPNSLRGTWAASDGEIQVHGADTDPLVLEGHRERRVRCLAETLAAGAQRYVVSNYEMLSVHPRRPPAWFDQLLEVCRSKPGVLIADESTAVKSHNAHRTRAVIQLARLFPYRMVLTGTPLTRSPLDLYAQFELLDKSALGYSTFLAFERAYTIKQRRKVGKSYRQLVVDYQNLEELKQRAARLSFRVRAADCLNLPPARPKRVDVTMSPDQSRVLKQLSTDMMADIDQGELVDGRNILVRYAKSAQVLGGWVRTMDEAGQPTGEVHAFDPNPKLKALVDLLEHTLGEDPERKVVVFAQYTPEVQGVVRELRRWGALEFSGQVTPAQREEHRQSFNTDPSHRVLVCQYQAGARGLNLTVADTAVFYSLTFSWEHFEQARKRIHRKGQTKPVTEFYLVGQRAARGGRVAATLDSVMLEALQQKKGLADVVTGDLELARKLAEDIGC
jgi:SNF2 family DNA or RNA helicase